MESIGLRLNGMQHWARMGVRVGVHWEALNYSESGYTAHWGVELLGGHKGKIIKLYINQVCYRPLGLDVKWVYRFYTTHIPRYSSWKTLLSTSGRENAGMYALSLLSVRAYVPRRLGRPHVHRTEQFSICTSCAPCHSAFINYPVCHSFRQISKRLNYNSKKLSSSQHLQAPARIPQTLLPLDSLCK